MRFPVPLSDAEQKLLLRAEALLIRCHNRISETTTLSDLSTAGKLFQMHLGAHDREIRQGFHGFGFQQKLVSANPKEDVFKENQVEPNPLLLRGFHPSVNKTTVALHIALFIN